MEAKRRRIATGAVIAGAGVLIARSLGPKLHERCQDGCGCKSEQSTAELEPVPTATSSQEVRRAA